MQYIVYFDICALCIVSIELLMFYVKKNMKSLQHKLFIVMLWLLMGSAVLDMVCALYRNHTINVPYSMKLIALYGYFIFHSSLPYMLTMYILASTQRIYEIAKSRRAILTAIPMLMVYVLLAINIFKNIVFTVQSDGSYTRHFGLVFIYAQAVLYFASSFIYIFRYRKAYDFYKRISVYMLITLTLIPVVIQIVYPYILVEVFGETLGFQVMYLCIQNPEETISKQLGIYKKNIFIEKARINFKTYNSFNLVSVSIDDWEFLQKTFGVDALNQLMIAIVEEIKKIVAKDNVEMYKISENEIYITGYKENVNYRQLAERLLEQCEKTWIIGNVEIPVTFDMCIIKCPEDFDNVDDIFECTDYITKENHSYGSRILDAKEINGSFGKRLTAVRHAIHKAIRDNTLEVYYQPIYSVKEKKVLSAEALVRLKDDELGFIPPDEFIPIAEADGSIVQIGNYVLESVCRFMMESNLVDKGIEFIEINVSMVECMKRDMADRIAAMLKKYELNPEQVNLEVTETAASNSAEILNNNMKCLVEKGIAFSLDDYGSGYSNISYIINLPFNLVKMDKNIVWSAFDNDKAGTVLESSVSMIQKLNLKIVAEGVETKEQMEALTKMGCEYLQGYYFSKPLPEKEFLDYLDSQTICDV